MYLCVISQHEYRGTVNCYQLKTYRAACPSLIVKLVFMCTVIYLVTHRTVLLMFLLPDNWSNCTVVSVYLHQQSYYWPRHTVMLLYRHPQSENWSHDTAMLMYLHPCCCPSIGSQGLAHVTLSCRYMQHLHPQSYN